MPEVGGEAAGGGGGVVDELGAVEAELAPAFGEVAVVADVDADFADGGVEDGPAEVSGLEVVLLPEAFDLGDVVFAVFAEVGAVGVDHGRGVVVEAGLFDFEHGDDDDHAGFACEFAHAGDGGAVGDGFGPVVVLGFLDLAEVGALKTSWNPMTSAPCRAASRACSSCLAIMDAVSPVQVAWTRAARTTLAMSFSFDGTSESFYARRQRQ